MAPSAGRPGAGVSWSEAGATRRARPDVFSGQGGGGARCEVGSGQVAASRRTKAAVRKKEEQARAGRQLAVLQGMTILVPEPDVGRMDGAGELEGGSDGPDRFIWEEGRGETCREGDEVLDSPWIPETVRVGREHACRQEGRRGRVGRLRRTRGASRRSGGQGQGDWGGEQNDGRRVGRDRHAAIRRQGQEDSAGQLTVVLARMGSSTNAPTYDGLVSGS